MLLHFLNLLLRIDKSMGFTEAGDEDRDDEKSGTLQNWEEI